MTSIENKYDKQIDLLYEYAKKIDNPYERKNHSLKKKVKELFLHSTHRSFTNVIKELNVIIIKTQDITKLKKLENALDLLAKAAENDKDKSRFEDPHKIMQAITPIELQLRQKIRDLAATETNITGNEKVEKREIETEEIAENKEKAEIKSRAERIADFHRKHDISITNFVLLDAGEIVSPQTAEQIAGEIESLETPLSFNGLFERVIDEINRQLRSNYNNPNLKTLQEKRKILININLHNTIGRAYRDRWGLTQAERNELNKLNDDEYVKKLQEAWMPKIITRLVEEGYLFEDEYRASPFSEVKVKYKLDGHGFHLQA